MKDIYLTKEGLKSLKNELKGLIGEKRPKLVKRVAIAREMGDLSENSEYASAREELSILDGRIEELETIITKAKIIRNRNTKAKRVGLGCRVTVTVNQKKQVYSVVGEWEADPIKKKISHSSPLGKALLGKKIGDEVEIEAPVGKLLYKIKNIH